jgi:hypothetical protein
MSSSASSPQRDDRGARDRVDKAGSSSTSSRATYAEVLADNARLDAMEARP